MNRINIHFGALCPTILEQVESQGMAISKKDANLLEKQSFSATLLHVNGLLTDSEVHRVRNRLMKRIARKVKQ